MINPFASSSHGEKFTPVAKHCSTCQCAVTQAYFQMNRPQVQQAPLQRPSQRISHLVQSRVVPAHDPVSMEVGDHVMPNRTVWFKSVSPRPTKITIRISSPDRPNLRPSESSLSVSKQTLSRVVSNQRGSIRLSRVEDPENNQITPLKKLVSKSTFDQNSTSTIYSPQQSERKNIESQRFNTMISF